MSIFSNRLGLERGLSVALFPMVILTHDHRTHVHRLGGTRPYEALKQGLGSLLAASLAYLVMRNREVQHLFFVFPELLLVLWPPVCCSGAIPATVWWNSCASKSC